MEGGLADRKSQSSLYMYSNAEAAAGKAFSIGRNGVITRLLRADGRAMLLHPSKHINIITVKIPSIYPEELVALPTRMQRGMHSFALGALSPNHSQYVICSSRGWYILL